MRVSLIISTYNQPASLGKVLRGVTRQTLIPQEIIIADDGSGEPTCKLIEIWRSESPFSVKHLWHPDEGFRKTIILNKAVAAASGEYLILLDGDCVPHRKFVADHVELAEHGFWVQGRRCFVSEPFAADFVPGQTSLWQWMVAGRITGAAKGVRLPFPIVRRNMRQRGIIGCNMGFWREDLVAINGFDEAYSGWGIGDDSDLGTRLYHLGRPRKFVYAHAIVYHLNHPSLPRGNFHANRARLKETIQTRKIRCERGLDQYLSPTPG